ncbi:hypothetical protein DVA81_18150, partial [Acinetobacter baumannii]
QFRFYCLTAQPTQTMFELRDLWFIGMLLNYLSKQFEIIPNGCHLKVQKWATNPMSQTVISVQLA